MDQTMMEKILPANMIISNFVKGEPDSNYEKYLLEMLNISNHFKKKSTFNFFSPKSEAHGECDAISDDYQIDFKLLASKKSLQAQSLFSHQVARFADGVIAFGECQQKNGNIKAARIFAAFRGKSVSELEDIFYNHSHRTFIDMEIYQVLKILKKPKNLLLFFPYEFSFQINYNEENAYKSISEGLQNDFKNAFIFRDNAVPGFDTYLTCIYNESFLLFQVRQGELSFCEAVNTKMIPTYQKLKSYNEWF